MIWARKNLSGFSLIEIVLVVAIVGLLTAIGAPIYQSLSNINELDVATNLLVQDLYRAQSYSRNVAHDDSWGVAINGQIISLFEGASYAARNAAFDDNYSVPGSISLSGSSQLVYAKLSGLPSGAASFNLSIPGKNRVVTVNPKGLVDY